MVCQYESLELNTCEMQNLVAYLTLCVASEYVTFVYVHTTHQLFLYILILNKESSVESVWFPEFHMTY